MFDYTLAPLRSRRPPEAAPIATWPVETLPDGWAVVRMPERPEPGSVEGLRRVIATALAAGSRRLVVDLTGVPFHDSTGLSACVVGLQAARWGGGDLRLAGANARAREWLALSSLDHLLPAYDTVEQALAAA